MGSGGSEKGKIQAALDEVRREERAKRQVYLIAVSYTHLTLPTKRIV